MTVSFRDGVRLVPATIELLNLEDDSIDALARTLGVASPPSWPSEFNGPESRAWVRKRLSAHLDHGFWYSRYIIAQDDEKPLLAGIAGYKGPPDDNGRVEIGYSVVVELQRHGIATSAVRQLCASAFQNGVRTIIAHTLPRLVASQAVLLKAGFQKSLIITDPDDGVIWQYQLERPVGD